MRRRQMIYALTGMALGSSQPLAALEASRQGLDRALHDDGDRWNEQVARYAQTVYTTAPEVLCEQLAVDIGVLERVMARRPGDADLERAAAVLGMVLAVTLTEIGQAWMARRWWDSAIKAADKSGDLGMRLTVRWKDAVTGLYDERPLTEVLALTDETLALADGRACPGTAGALATRAQALARSGRPEEAAEAVRAVQEITSRMPAKALADESLFGWPEHRLRHTESFVYTEIGDIARALAAQERALELYPPIHSAGNRAMVQMHHASCLIKDGHIADGLRHASEVLDAVPTERRGQLLYEVGRRAAGAVPDRERGRPEFRELRDRLAALPGR